MYDKNYYRTRFNEIKDLIKFSVVADECDVKRPYISQFMKNEKFDDLISLSDLDRIYTYLNNRLHCF